MARYRMEVSNTYRWYKVFDTTMFRVGELDGVKVLQHYSVPADQLQALVKIAAKMYNVDMAAIKYTEA